MEALTKLGTCLLQWSLSSRGRVYTVEPLCKGQVGDGSIVPYTVEPLYKGQVEMGPLSLIQWSLSTRDKLRWVHCPLYNGASLQKLEMGPLSLVER